MQVAAADLVEIGEHCMLANGCFVTDANHRFDDPDKPVPWQGFTSKGPTRLGDNVWLGANVVVTSGVTIGERCVVGANSVVTTDLPPLSIAAGAPAKVLRTIEYPVLTLGQHDVHAVAPRRAAKAAKATRPAPRRRAPTVPSPRRAASAERAMPSTDEGVGDRDEDAGRERDPDDLEDVTALTDAEHSLSPPPSGCGRVTRAAPEDPHEQRDTPSETTTGPAAPSPNSCVTP